MSQHDNSSTPLDIVRATYEGSSEDNARNLQAALSPEVVWTEAAGFSYAGTYHGPKAVQDNVFQRLATEWKGYTAHAQHYIWQEESVAVFGVYSGEWLKTGKPMEAAFAHMWTVKDGKITRFVQVVDTKLVWDAMA